MVDLIPVDEVCFCVHVCCQMVNKEEFYLDALGETALLISAWFELLHFDLDASGLRFFSDDHLLKKPNYSFLTSEEFITW